MSNFLSVRSVIGGVSQRSSATQFLILCKHNLCKYGVLVYVCIWGGGGGCLDGIVLIGFYIVLFVLIGFDEL